MTFRARHLLGIEHLHPTEITTLLDLADKYANQTRNGTVDKTVLAGMTQINMFFENSTRTQASFEIAGKRLGADVMNMSMQASSPRFVGRATPQFRRCRFVGAKSQRGRVKRRRRTARTSDTSLA
jgi:hypothetical protein